MGTKEFELYDFYEKTHWWFKGRRKILSQFLGLIPEKEKKSVLEIGCGTGGNLNYLFNNFDSRTGFEFDSAAIEYGQAKCPEKTQIFQGDANQLALNKKFDCIALLDVLYHKNIKSVDDVLSRVNQHLDSKGYILIADGAFDFLAGSHNETVGHARRFTLPQMENHLEKAGFEIVKSSYWGLSLFFLLFLKRCIVEKILPPAPPEDESLDILSVPVLDQFLYLSLIWEPLFLKFASLPLGASIAILAQKK